MLGMFERIARERGSAASPAAEDPAVEDTATRWRLRNENAEPSTFCRDMDGWLGGLAKKVWG